MAETTLPLQSIAELSGLLRTGAISPVELLEQTLARIERLNPALNAYITVTAELAREQARLAESEIRAGRYRGPLHGVPYAAKDLCFTRGIRTTAGSKILRDFTPSYDGTVVVRLRRAGAVLVGKAGLHENAYGITSDNPHFGSIHNPWDLERIPGGSSGGSGAALASGLCSFSLGTDTGGSIRIPAAFCSVTGLKPTFGRVSRYGVFPLGHTLDHVGPFALTAEECGWTYAAIAGFDPHEDASIDRPVELPSAAETDLRGVRVGVPEAFYFDDLDPEVEAACRAALATFESLGAVVEPIQLPDIEELNAVARVILLAEATAVHQRNLDARPEDFGEDQIALLDQGRFITAVDYLNAQRRRRELCQAFARAFERVDWMAAPAVAVLPAKIGQKTLEIRGMRHDVRLATTRNARALNLTGLPLLTLPCGFSADGLPIGLQLIGDAYDERRILAAGMAFQEATDFHRRRPPTL
ncbi:MAG: Asp-tRNA(Asn)/Glu-tRNA(Gln) amidotransferase GatCAB subunit A [Acidobacteria bacterium]|nr:Asp-tRNA(Asn)/Glu-tRNA(Gln) amidotransferase GatCAB subunit A [Acidobacteriota bacterium]